MSTSKKALWTIIASAGFTAVLLLSKRFLSFDSEGMHLVVALMPLIIWLVVSDKLKEITGPGGFGIALHDQINKKAVIELDDEPVDVELSIMRPKGGPSQLTAALDDGHAVSLSFRLSYDGYNDEAIKSYIHELTKNSLLKYVVFLDDEKRFKGLILPSDFSSILYGQGVAQLIHSGSIMKRREVILKSVSEPVSNREVLSEMDEANIPLMPVVDDKGYFAGAVRQEDVVRRISHEGGYCW